MYGNINLLAFCCCCVYKEHQKIATSLEKVHQHHHSHFSQIIEKKAMAPHSSTLAWKIPWAEEPGRLQSMGRQELDTTERLHFHFSLSCIGEGNGNPLQCSCLENPRDRGVWWAAVYGVAQSRTRLKRLSSSSSSSSRGIIVKLTRRASQWNEQDINLFS